MPVIINHDLCCYAKGTCGCISVRENHPFNPLTVLTRLKYCVDVCPVKALTRNERIVVNADLCSDCGVCIQNCCSGAISLLPSQE